ncbi:MAG: hypothetical protein ACI9EW_000431 [Cellvibrionaceae bacterium]
MSGIVYICPKICVSKSEEDLTIDNQPSAIQTEIEKIIGDIRKQILADYGRSSGKMSYLKVDGDYFSADFYENLYQASISQHQLQLQVTKTDIPIIGGLIDRFRTALHQVILFYLNQVLSEQARVNRLNSQLINELGLEIEKLGQQMAPQNGATTAE